MKKQMIEVMEDDELRNEYSRVYVYLQNLQAELKRRGKNFGGTNTK